MGFDLGVYLRMTVMWYMSDLHACGYVRGDVPARQINRERCDMRVVCKGEVLLSDFWGAQVMVFQRPHAEGVLARMRQARDRGIRTVYDLDDDLLKTPVEFDRAGEFYNREDVRATIVACLREADVVTCSTGPLAASLKDACPSAARVVVPNCLDVEAWETAFARREARARAPVVTIGWMASGSHKLDAPLVMPAIERVMRERPDVQLHLIGWIGWENLTPGLLEMRDRVEVDGWVGIGELPGVMADFDIGIAPLLDTPFNEAKSGIKAMQYWALGIPVVCSALAPYGLVEHERTGLCVEGVEAWTQALMGLVDDAEKRRWMGAQGRLELLEKWDVRVRYLDWVRAYDFVVKGGA
jgi:glycosyltransferase involved in cell wall biosynthesis